MIPKKKIQGQVFPEFIQQLSGVSKELSKLFPPFITLTQHVSCYHSLGSTCSPMMAPSVPSIIAFRTCVQNQERKDGCPHEPFLLGCSPMVRIKDFSQMPLAGITCVDHMTTFSCNRVWESRSGKENQLSGQEQASVNIYIAQDKSTK